MDRRFATTATALLVCVLLYGCGPQEVDPVSRAAILGCIEIAEITRGTHASRALLLEQAGCGRFDEKAITAILPEYRAEQAAIAADEEAERRREIDGCGRQQARANYLAGESPEKAAAQEAQQERARSAQRFADIRCRNVNSDERAEAADLWAARFATGEANPFE